MTAMELPGTGRFGDTIGVDFLAATWRPDRGSTLLETCAALALAATAAVAMLSGTRPLACALRVGAARTALVDALLEARREAYLRETTTSLAVTIGSGSVTLQPSGSIRDLGDGVSIRSGPSDGEVQFRATGLADNATLEIACGDSTASVVVNQRGVIR